MKRARSLTTQVRSRPWGQKKHNLGFIAHVDTFYERIAMEKRKELETESWKLAREVSMSDNLEEFHQLRENVLLRQAGQPLQTLAICKATAGEGSSRIAYHLAMSFASNPRTRVLLIDGDIHHPSLHQLLQVNQESGLHEILLEGAGSAKDRLKSTVLPNLSVLTSGRPAVSHRLTISPVEFADILQVVCHQFSIVIVDTSPVLVDAAASVIAAQCDGTILVTRAEKTRWEVVQEAQSRLQTAGANLIGAVLNQRTYPIPDMIYNRL